MIDGVEAVIARVAYQVWLSVLVTRRPPPESAAELYDFACEVIRDRLAQAAPNTVVEPERRDQPYPPTPGQYPTEHQLLNEALIALLSSGSIEFEWAMADYTKPPAYV